MYCPSCGQEQVSGETRFCSRCGLLLTVIAEVMKNDGALPQDIAAPGSKTVSRRKRGIKQGLFIFLLTFLVVPLIAILTLAAGAEPYVVVISAILFGVGGLLRMAYALLFEEDAPKQEAFEQIPANPQKKFFGKTKSAKALPPQQSIPVSAYHPPKQGNWRDTNDLAQPSVTEGTTKLLQDE